MNNISKNNLADTSWLYWVVLTTLFVYLVKMIPYFLYFTTFKVDTIVIDILVYIAACIVGIKALRMDLIFIKEENVDISSDAIDKQIDKSISYSNYGLKEPEAAILEKKLMEIMENEKPYLNSELNLKDLSDLLNVYPHYITQLLNIRFNQNFYEFINSYRLKAVLKELNNPAKEKLTIFTIASDCGFNSQPPFNRFFKQKMGITPSKYRQQVFYSDLKDIPNNK